jgi:hypothetical protein
VASLLGADRTDQEAQTRHPPTRGAGRLDTEETGCYDRGESTNDCRRCDIPVWWLIVAAILVVEVICWTYALRLPPGRRVDRLPLRVENALSQLLLLAYALAHIGGPLGAAFSQLPQWPGWVYGVLTVFLAFRVFNVVVWAVHNLRRRISPPLVPLLPEAES